MNARALLVLLCLVLTVLRGSSDTRVLSFQFNGTDLGLALRESSTRPGLPAVVAVRGAAEAQGMPVGGHLLTINGAPVLGAPLDDVRHLVRNSLRPLYLRVELPTPAASPTSLPSAFVDGIGRVPLPAPLPAPPPQAPLSQESLQAQLHHLGRQVEASTRLFSQGQVDQAMALVGQAVEPFVSDGWAALHVLRSPVLEQALQTVVLLAFLLEEAGDPATGHQLLLEGQRRFPSHSEMQWQELKLRPFSHPPDGRCWNASVEGERPWDKRSATQVPLDCCLLPGSPAPPASSTEGPPSWARRRVAVLYRGHATRPMAATLRRSFRMPDEADDPPVFDFRDLWARHETDVLEPLKAAGAAKLDVFVSVHSSALDDDVLSLLKPTAWHFEKGPDSLQGKQLADGMALIDSSQYDTILVLRLDLVFKQPVTSWDVDFGMLNVPFRSINDRPEYCTCQVADTIMVLPAHMKARLVDRCGVNHKSCHGLGGSFHDVHLLVRDQCYNSNTGVPADDLHVSQNPLYALYARHYDYDDAPIPHSPGGVLGFS